MLLVAVLCALSIGGFYSAYAATPTPDDTGYMATWGSGFSAENVLTIEYNEADYNHLHAGFVSGVHSLIARIGGVTIGSCTFIGRDSSPGCNITFTGVRDASVSIAVTVDSGTSEPAHWTWYLEGSNNRHVGFGGGCPSGGCQTTHWADGGGTRTVVPGNWHFTDLMDALD
jgi:hypothetical protein